MPRLNRVVSTSTLATSAELGAGTDVVTADGAAGSVHSKLRRADIVVSTLRPQAATYLSRSTSSGWLANALLFDTGGLAAGEYELVFTGTLRNGAAHTSILNLQHRNAANGADIASQQIVDGNGEPATQSHPVLCRWPRFTIALNERIRLIETAAVAASAFTRLDWSVTVRPVYG